MLYKGHIARYLLTLADDTVGLGWVGISTFHTTWSTRLLAPLHTTHAQYQFPNYCYPSFMCSPATPIRTLCTALAMRSDIIIMLHAMHNRHINLV